MKSPFPGMDPYIEACGLWEGFHHRLIAAIYRAVATMLPKGYIPNTAVRKYVVTMGTEGNDESMPRPDVMAELVADAESVPMQAFKAWTFEETCVEIIAGREERALVTCIEVLSPPNKRQGTEGWKQFRRKRQAMLLGRANFIEIDLLRGGSKMPMLTPWPNSPYTLLVSRMRRPTHARVWKAYFDRPLSLIPVPLLSSDPDLTLDLQPLIDDIYSLGRYDEQIDYGRRLKPALSEAEAPVVRKFLKERSRR